MRYSLLLSLALVSHTAAADEYTVEPKPFNIETTLNAVFLPAESQAISIKPEAWSDFTITSLVPQGAVVKKGDTLIGIDTRALDDHIAAMEKARQDDALSLAQAKHDLAQLEITTPRSLEAYARGEKEALENLDWYTGTGHAKEIEETKRSVKTAEFALEYQKEELKQLLKMYGEDQKTEETEEIILKRTREGVDRAEFALKSAKSDAEWKLNTSIPRKLKSMQLAAENAKIANASAKEDLPRTLEQKRLAVAKAIHDDAEKAKKLAKLKADRAMMNIVAPADGLVYYGELQDGRWNPANAVKVLNIGGKLPGSMTLMSFVPAKAPLVLTAFAAETSLSALSQGATGYAITHLDPYQSFPVTLTELGGYPEIDGSFRATLKPTLPKGLAVVPGMKATTRIITHKMDKALKIPVGYLSRADAGGYTVKVKLADGNTADRAVTTGPSNKEWVVITKGLEQGQVIVK
ncbi:MAG: hypothetical protein H7A51_13030 [Akkermansiaceae bacterium]|nr:hypothetical protein [Akkermansiaceae bacterium]